MEINNNINVTIQVKQQQQKYCDEVKLNIKHISYNRIYEKYKAPVALGLAEHYGTLVILVKTNHQANYSKLRATL